ncbi:MAG TPA: hypothetical protein VM452_07830 [Caulifigura sp.]|nr:hypothetical protein [Caulifigura sp.]
MDDPVTMNEDTTASPKRGRWRWLILPGVVLIGGALYAAWDFFLISLPVWSLVYCAETSFEQLPANDLALVDAIKSMDTRVREDRVEVQRCDYDGAIRVTYRMTGDLWNRPGIEQLDRFCAELGYQRPRGKFAPSDVTDNTWQERHDRHRDLLKTEGSGPPQP